MWLQTIASGTLDSLEITLDKAVEAGTALTLTITCDNYKDSSCNVTAKAAAAAAEQAEEEEAAENTEQDTETVSDKADVQTAESKSTADTADTAE